MQLEEAAGSERQSYLQVGHSEQRQQGEGNQVEQSRLSSAMDPGGHGGSQQTWTTTQQHSISGGWEVEWVDGWVGGAGAGGGHWSVGPPATTSRESTH